jgi:phosphonate transport system ATP-binding protein
MSRTAIEVEQLRKSFAGRPALRSVSFRVEAGEMVALLGASGSGKSTLLRHINGLHRADAGPGSTVRVLDRSVQQGGRLAPDVRAVRSQIASIFQQFNLVDRLPVMSNVLAGALHLQPLWRALTGRFPQAERELAWQALQRVGIESCAWQRASTLSGGQQQRAAICRALLQQPQLLLADEPIASLDPHNARVVMDALRRINREDGITVLCNLHHIDTARSYCDRIVAMQSGRIVFDGPPGDLTAERVRAIYGVSEDEFHSTAMPDGTLALA